MFFLAPLILSVGHGPDYAFVRVKDANVEIVTATQGKESVIRSKKLPLTVPGVDLREQTRNDMLIRSCALAVDRKSHTLFALDVVGTVLGASGSTDGWKSVCNVVSFSYSGKIIHSARVTIPWDGGMFLGHDDKGEPLLLWMPSGPGKYKQWKRGRWSECDESTCPPSFARLLRLDANNKAWSAALYPGQSIQFWNSVPENADWIDVDFPVNPYGGFYNAASASEKRGYAVYNETTLMAKWNGREFKFIPDKEYLYRLRFLSYPLMVGMSRGANVLKEYEPYLLFTAPPFVSTTLYEINLETRTTRSLGNGFYIVPLR